MRIARPAFPHDPFEVELDCSSCQTSFAIEVQQVAISPSVPIPKTASDVVLDKIVTCPRCGAVDAFELSRQSGLNLATLALGASPDSKADHQAAPVIRARVGAWDGTIVRNQSTNLEHLTQLAPTLQSAEAFRRLGNLLERLGRVDEAEQAWQRSLALDKR